VRRFHDQNVAAQLVQHSFGRVSDEQAFESRAGYRSHDDDGAVDLARGLFDVKPGVSQPVRDSLNESRPLGD